MSYITLKELNSRYGTEKDEQRTCMVQELEIIHPSLITTETLVDSSSSLSTMDAGSDWDNMSVEEDLCDDGDDESTDPDMTIFSAEVESVSR